MRLDRIVIGVDFSPTSVQATRWCTQFLCPDADVTLVNCCEIPAIPSFFRGSLPHREELERTLREGAEKRLGELRASLSAERVHCEIRSGSVVPELAAVAHAREADLVVMGEHGLRPGVWKLLGSTTERFIHSTPFPLLVVRNAEESAPRVALLALDDDSNAARIMEAGILLSERTSRVVLFHAVADYYRSVTGYAMSQQEARKLQDHLEEDALKWLHEVGECHGLAGDSAAFQIRTGDPRHELIATAEQHRADLVVIGSHRSGVVREALLGCVARSVLHGSSPSVLVVGREERSSP